MNEPSPRCVRNRAIILILCTFIAAFAQRECLAANLLDNPDFEIDLSGWAIAQSAPPPATYVSHWPYGWNDSSGSLGLTADVVSGNGNEVTVTQCVSDPSETVDASIEAFSFDPPEQSILVVNLWVFGAPNCAGTLLSVLALEPDAPLQMNSWTTFRLHQHAMPSGTTSVLLEVVVSTGTGLADYMVDHATLEPDAIFVFGFDPAL